MKEVSHRDQLTDSLDALGIGLPVAVTDPSCVQGLGIGKCVGGLIASCTHPLNPALHCRMALGIKAFNPNLSLLEVKAQNGVVAPDPKARHGIASPGVCGFEPGGGVVTQPACPVPRIERAQSFKRIGGSHLSGQSPATTLLERVSCQGEPTARSVASPSNQIKPASPCSWASAWATESGSIQGCLLRINVWGLA